jgi:hypothetical protein
MGLSCPNPQTDAIPHLAMFWCKQVHFLSVSSFLELAVRYDVLFIEMDHFLALHVDW